MGGIIRWGRIQGYTLYTDGIEPARRGMVPSPSYELGRCIVCGHTDACVIADADAMRAEVELLWEYHARRLKPETPTDRLMDRVAFSEPPPLRLVQCVECGLLYRNPVERIEELTEIYARTTPSPDVLRSLHETQLAAVRTQARELRETLGRGGSGLEVGSYVGAFLEVARDEGLNVEGLDINPEVNEFTRSLGFVVHDGELAMFAPGRVFDAIAIWNTFDQLADPRAAVHAARGLLSESGILAVRVPNGEFYARLREQMMNGSKVTRAAARAVLAQNNLLTFPYRWGFTPDSLRRLVEEAGFAIDHFRGDVLVPISDEWTKSWARVEETLIKRTLGAVASLGEVAAPWFEVYARR
jgi:2-polyprenyl-3-methyl-5-hydroxy-6-metoxy-1,4-benzoquinol methylase